VIRVKRIKLLIFGAFMGVVLFTAGYFMDAPQLQYGGFALVGTMFAIFMVIKFTRKPR